MIDSISARVIKAMKDRNMTLARLAAASDIPLSRLIAICRWDAEVTSPEVFQLADALEYEPDYLALGRLPARLEDHVDLSGLSSHTRAQIRRIWMRGKNGPAGSEQ